MRPVPTNLTLICMLTTGVLATGCQRGEDPSSETVTADELPDSAGLVCGDEADAGASGPDGGVPEGCFWQSSDWSSNDWLEYPARRTLSIEHGLGRIPTQVLVYISFEPSGNGSALAAGDLARFHDITDTVVEIENDTNSDYYFRVVLE